MGFELTTLDKVNFPAYVEAFNAAYADYFVPMHLPVPVMQNLIEREAIDEAQSVVAVDGKTIVGMGMLGIRAPYGWIGGMGVIPAYRRQGIARAIMQQLLANGRALNLTAIDLEVITQNVGAYHLYADMGFVKLRTLVILDRGVHPVEAVPDGYSVHEIAPEVAFSHFDAFHDLPNPWQRSKYAIDYLLESMNAYGVHQDGELVGYALGWLRAERVQIMDAAIHPAAPDRTTAATALLAGLLGDHPKATSGMVNVREDDMLLTAMQALGYRPTMSQYEMRFSG